MRGNKNRRKGISPIIATLTLVAVTLVAAVAVGGFVFGIFGTQTSTPQVTVVYAQITADDGSGTLTIQVGGNAPSAYNGTIVLRNSGTSSIGISGLSLTYGGSTTFATATEGDTTIASGETKTIYIVSLKEDATAGQPFTGAVVLSNGAQIFFTGTFA